MKSVLVFFAMFASVAMAKDLVCAREGSYHTVAISESNAVAVVGSNLNSQAIFFKGSRVDGAKVYSSADGRLKVVVTPSDTADVFDSVSGQMSVDLPCESPNVCKIPDAGC